MELADNQIRALGPMNLGKTCPRLTNLDLSYNQIRRVENIRGLTCLTRLYVANNKLTTIGMEESNRLVSLAAGVSPDAGARARGEDDCASKSDTLSEEAVGLEFECLAGLEELYLSHNGIGSFNDAMLAQSTMTTSRHRILDLNILCQYI